MKSFNCQKCYLYGNDRFKTILIWHGRVEIILDLLVLASITNKFNIGTQLDDRKFRSVLNHAMIFSSILTIFPLCYSINVQRHIGGFK